MAFVAGTAFATLSDIPRFSLPMPHPCGNDGPHGWLRQRRPRYPSRFLDFGPWRQPEGALPRLIIHFIGVDVLTPPAAAVYGPLTTLNLNVLRVTLVSNEEGTYGGFLGSVVYRAVVPHDGRLSSASPQSGCRLPRRLLLEGWVNRSVLTLRVGRSSTVCFSGLPYLLRINVASEASHNRSVETTQDDDARIAYQVETVARWQL